MCCARAGVVFNDAGLESSSRGLGTEFELCRFCQNVTIHQTYTSTPRNGFSSDLPDSQLLPAFVCGLFEGAVVSSQAGSGSCFLVCDARATAQPRGLTWPDWPISGVIHKSLSGLSACSDGQSSPARSLAHFLPGFSGP
ncbi:hypothetical protein RRG08_037411 [Elysia crispata]|uniref:Uncharacterized protein n=1 Tax=Elysia crispata TaxID=231223 RepID=A0AAE1DXR1_9GAST|nr:hypothetical protein RRG08_037411 [Elysia crispata]